MRALVAAIVERATKDALGVGPQTTPADVADGRAFFADGRYDDAVSMLGLGPDILPEEIEEALRANE